MQNIISSAIQNKTSHKLSTGKFEIQKLFKSVQPGSDKSMPDVVENSMNSCSMNSVSSTMSQNTSNISEEVTHHSTKIFVWKDEDFALSLQTPSHQKHILPQVKQLPDELYYMLLSYCKIHYIKQILEKSAELFDTILYRELWRSTDTNKCIMSPKSLLVSSKTGHPFSPEDKHFDIVSPRRGSTEHFTFAEEFAELTLVHNDDEVLEWFGDTEFKGNQCHRLKQLRESQLKFCSIENEVLNLVEEIEEVVCFHMKKTEYYKNNSKDFKLWLRQLSCSISDNLLTPEEQITSKNDWQSSLNHLVQHRNMCIVEISNTLYQVASYFTGQKVKREKKSRKTDLLNSRRMLDPSDEEKLMVCESYQLPSVLLEQRRRAQPSNSLEEYTQLAFKLESFYAVVCSLRKKHKRLML